MTHNQVAYDQIRIAAQQAYYAFRATTPGSTAEEEAYLHWIELGDKLTRLDRQIIRASWSDDARRQS
jgi:hypothetical protein